MAVALAGAGSRPKREALGGFPRGSGSVFPAGGCGTARAGGPGRGERTRAARPPEAFAAELGLRAAFRAISTTPYPWYRRRRCATRAISDRR